MKTIAAFAYPNCQILDVTGPMQVFASANKAVGKTAYNLQILGLNRSPVVTNSGMRLLPDAAFIEIDSIDTLFLAGGHGVSDVIRNSEVIKWVQEMSARVRRLASVCSGAFLLAEAGLLHGKKAATHWCACDKLAARYDDIDVEPDAIWINQGKLYTSAGVTSGIDLALALVEEDLGHAVSMEIAKELVVFMKRPGGQAQYSSQLQAQNKASGIVAKALSYIESNITEDLPLHRLSEVCCVSERHLFRLFKKEIGCSPTIYLESNRLDLAQKLLVEASMNNDQVAMRSGMGSADNLRKVFIRRLGITPSEYKQRFGKTGQVGVTQ
ncbi:MAG: GlxA family transcriptional regulator [Neptuniibacter sp.]